VRGGGARHVDRPRPPVRCPAHSGHALYLPVLKLLTAPTHGLEHEAANTYSMFHIPSGACCVHHIPNHALIFNRDSSGTGTDVWFHLFSFAVVPRRKTRPARRHHPGIPRLPGGHMVDPHLSALLLDSFLSLSLCS
jgi:hypothetical protein